jgi:hypothetical protein
MPRQRLLSSELHETYHTSYVDPRILLNIVIGVNGYEVGRFGELIHDYPNQIKLAAVKEKPTIKSILMSSHFHSGILSGHNNPSGFI